MMIQANFKLKLLFVVLVGLSQPIANAAAFPQPPLIHSVESQPIVLKAAQPTQTGPSQSVDQRSQVKRAQLTTLVHFSFGNGAYPNGQLTLGGDGNYYGMTSNGGNIAFCVPLGCGTFFKMTPAGKLTTLHIFTNLAFGFLPVGGFTLGRDGNFYGSTFGGGGNLDGNILRMTPAGRVTKVVDFQGNNGRSPYAGLLLAKNGTFYGTTQQGGANNRCPSDGCGTVFQVTSAGRLTPLVSFRGNNGEKPSGRLLQASDGSFYGTTEAGGSNGKGTVFQLTLLGKLRTLVNFSGRNGQSPEAGLTLGKDRMFYGTTAEGGAGKCRGGCGTIFRMSASGQLKTLLSFSGRNGREPLAGLTLGDDGNFYGTTFKGGNSTQCTDGCGTLFKFSPASSQLTTLIHFNKVNGSRPAADLLLSKDGRLYGTTYLGGRNSAGTVFRLSP